ncbi:MAG TPA: T9SS type A sorting domain-containing protein [Rubricoccaceae bacterium]|jgi:hypothetical protein
MLRLAFLAAACTLALPPATAQTPTRTFTSSRAEIAGRFGNAVDGVPDVNGDGRGDLLIGAPDEDGGDVNSGRVHVYLGSTGTLLRTIPSPSPEFLGAFGRAVAGIPDVNGDGRGDLIIGAPQESGGPSDAGLVFVFSGSTGALLQTLTSPFASAGGNFGSAVDAVPDASGDGVWDIVVGAPGEDGGAGVAYLFSGASGLLLRTLRSPGEVPFGSFGASVGGVPDATGDGRGDVVVGASRETGPLDESGQIHLFSGATGLLVRTIVSPSPEISGGFGNSVSGVADANGDGRGDLLVGASEEDGGALDSGRAYLISGATGVVLRTLLSPAPANEGEFGSSVDGVPDTDGDGRGDLVVGAYAENAGAGAAYLFSGGTGTLIRALTSPSPEPGSIVGFGSNVAGVEDATGDGRGDLLIGAPEEDGGLVGAGRAYLYTTQTRTVTLAGPEGWRLLAVPLATGMADLLAEPWTQGSAGADVSDGDPNVFGYTEALAGARAVGYLPLPDLRTPDLAGQGRAVYMFTDDDLITAGVQGGFPKTLAVSGHTRAERPVAFPVSFTPTGSVQEDGWTLAGNPFDLGLDWDAAGWTKVNVDNTLYVWDRTAGVFRTWNGTTGSLGDGIVAEFQGFWVKANAAAPRLVAPAAAAVSTPPPTTPLGPNLGLRLAGTLGGQPVEDAAFVSFVPGAADALDPFDAYELAPFSDTYAALYAEGPGALLDVEARGALAGPAVFTLGAAAVAAGQAAGGTFTLSWPDLASVPAAWTLTLTDLASGTAVDLRRQPNYTFTLAAGLAPERVLSSSVMTPPVPTPLAFASSDGFAPPARFLLRVEDAAVAGEPGAGSALALDAFPNPTAGASRVAFSLPAASDVRVAVLDALGREVAVLADGARPAGRHDVVVAAGRLAPGVYVVRLTAGAVAIVRRLTVVR